MRLADLALRHTKINNHEDMYDMYTFPRINLQGLTNHTPLRKQTRQCSSSILMTIRYAKYATSQSDLHFIRLLPILSLKWRSTQDLPSSALLKDGEDLKPSIHFIEFIYPDTNILGIGPTNVSTECTSYCGDFGYNDKKACELTKRSCFISPSRSREFIESFK